MSSTSKKEGFVITSTTRTHLENGQESLKGDGRTDRIVCVSATRGKALVWNVMKVCYHWDFVCFTTTKSAMLMPPFDDDEDMPRNRILDSNRGGDDRRISGAAENGGSKRSGGEGAMKAAAEHWTVAANGGGGMNRTVVGISNTRCDRNSMITIIMFIIVFLFVSQSVLLLAEATEISSNNAEEDHVSSDFDIMDILKMHLVPDEIPIVSIMAGIESISSDVLKTGDFQGRLESKEAGTATATVGYEKVRICLTWAHAGGLLSE
jgi:hypothetical protein